MWSPLQLADLVTADRTHINCKAEEENPNCPPRSVHDRVPRPALRGQETHHFGKETRLARAPDENWTEQVLLVEVCVCSVNLFGFQDDKTLFKQVILLGQWSWRIKLVWFSGWRTAVKMLISLEGCVWFDKIYNLKAVNRLKKNILLKSREKTSHVIVYFVNEQHFRKVIKVIGKKLHSCLVESPESMHYIFKEDFYDHLHILSVVCMSCSLLPFML